MNTIVDTPYTLDYGHHLIKLFGEMNRDQINHIFQTTAIIHLDRAQYLFHQGDEEKALYIVLSGRLRAIKSIDEQTHILGDISAGEPVGEIALFTNEVRSASILALRNSVVLKMDEQDYHVLIQSFPKLSTALTKYVIDRLRLNATEKSKSSVPKNIVVINLQPQNDIAPWASNVLTQLKSMNKNIRLFRALDQDENDPHTIFHTMESEDVLNLMLCDEINMEWTKQCIIYSDLVVVISNFYAPHHLYPIEEELRIYHKSILNKKIFLILLHPENAPRPINTCKWFEHRSIQMHIHVRRNNQRDIRRCSRLIIHQGIGLVLGGGGSKGYAHVGAVLALQEAGVEIDCVGGTSAGALYSMLFTLTEFDIEHALSICKKSVKYNVLAADYTIPFISLMKGKKMQHFLNELLGDLHLEDLWINTFMISTNYSDASMKVHDRGLIRKSLAASFAIPGIFPPVIIDGHYHVDGSVMDNLPISTMYTRPIGHVIAISLTSQKTRRTHLQTLPSSAQLLWDKITGRKKYRLPSLAALMINSLTINSRQKQEFTKSQAALYVELDLKEFGFMDANKWKLLVDKGYRLTKNHLGELTHSALFWKFA